MNANIGGARTSSVDFLLGSDSDLTSYRRAWGLPLRVNVMGRTPGSVSTLPADIPSLEEPTPSGR